MIHKSRILLTCMAMLSMVACVDEKGLNVSDQEIGLPLTFSASLKEQDWYGVNIATRSAGWSPEEAVPTDFVTEDGHRVFITDHEVNGIDSKQVKMGDPVPTRAYVSQALDTRKLSISQIGFTQGNNTNTDVELMNVPAVTTNGVEWSCNEYFVNRPDYTALRIFGALFPYNENYVFKTDDYEGKGNYYASLQWLYQFRVDYELNSNFAQEQEDLLYAKQIRTFTADVCAKEGPTHLAFGHAMTAVKVKLGPSGFVPCIIKEVRLKNVRNKGTFHFFDRFTGQSQAMMLDSNGWWDVDNTSMTTCSAVTDFDTQGEYNCYVTGDAATFMMIPQELPENAALELDIIFAQDPESVVTLTCPIGLRSKDNQPKYWNIGTTHEYVIDTKENAEGYYMLVDGVDRNDRVRYVDPEGGDASITLKSYKSVGSESEDATYAPLNWRYDGWSLDGVTWNDDLPKWLHMSFSNGTPIKQFEMYEGSVDGVRINIDVDAMPPEDNVSHADILKSRPEKGIVTNGAYDLSRHEWGTGASIGTTTANSYVIDAPGHYTFPTVYGNSMKNGVANPQAYGLSSTGVIRPNTSTSFVDYLGRQIISPLIQYNTKLKRAALLWEDVQGMVQDVKLTQRGDFVEFRIDREKIDQGNAVIAVFDELERLVWSWHIWVTDEDISATVPTGSGNFKAMPVNLGWKSVSKACAVRGRDIYLLFSQGEDMFDMIDHQTEMRITQRSSYINDAEHNHKGSSPYYQWGRKDPMVGAYNGKSISAHTYEARSFYTESFTTWKVAEELDIATKAIIFAAALTAGIAVTVATCGISTILISGALVSGAGGALYVGATAAEERLFSTTDQWGTTIPFSIQNPTCDIKSAMTWTDCKEHSPYHDLWGIGQDTDNKNKKVVKTIYDPCPVGFHVPEGNAFYGVESFNDGLSKGNLYLPACGARVDYIHALSLKGDFDIPLLDVGAACGYWTAAPCKESGDLNQHDNEWYRNSEGAYALIADKNKSGTVRGSYEAWDFNMRPIADY